MIAIALLSALAHAEDVVPTGTIDQVVVYPDRAAVTRVLSVDLVAGNNVIEFHDLPPTVDERTITAEGEGVEGAMLMGIDVVSRELAEDRRKRVSELETRIEKLADLIRSDRDNAEAARIELTFLSQLQTAAAQQASNELFFTDQTVAQADGLAKLLDERVPVAQKTMRESEWAARDKDAELGALRRELDATRGASQWARRDVRVEIESPKAGKGTVSVTYVLPGASWTPQYDVRANPDDKKLGIVLNALVVQTSGEDWTGTKLSLSTARPNDGIDPPKLDPFWLQPYVPPVYYSYDDYGGGKGDMAPAAEMAMDEEESDKVMEAPPPPPAPMAVAVATVTERAVATTFEVAGRTAVPGDGTRRKVRVTSLDLPVDFLHVSVPRFDDNAYLVASAKWEQSWPMLPGEVSTFLGDSFVGTSAIGLIGTGEEYEFGFGPDDAVQIKVTPLATMDSLPDWLGKITATRSWSFAVKNARKSAVHVELRDRIPQVTDAHYKLKYDGDVCDELTPDGLCTFIRDVQPASDVATTFGYVVRYPKKMPPAGVE